MPVRRRRRLAAATIGALVVIAVGIAVVTSDSGSSGGSGTPAQRIVTRDDALRAQVAAMPSVVREMTGRERPRGTVLCGLRVLGSDPDHAHLYAWLMCADYTTGPDASMGSGSSEPAVLAVKGAGTGVRVTGVSFPRQGRLLDDIARMFPADLAPTVVRGSVEVSPTQEELLALARSLPADG